MNKTFFNGKFVQHPVFKDRFVSKKSYSKLFYIECSGSIRKPMYDEYPDAASFLVSGIIENFGNVSILEEAVEKANLLVHHCTENMDLDGFGDNTFSPNHVKIYDRDRKLVLSGLCASGDIEWLVPVSNFQISAINNRVKQLAKEAGYERYCDCLSSADSLDRQAHELKSFITESCYRPYVVKMIEQYQLPNKTCPLFNAA